MCQFYNYDIFIAYFPNDPTIAIWNDQDSFKELTTVNSTNIINYIGYYYEVYVDSFVLIASQVDAICGTSQYGYINKFNMTLQNARIIETNQTYVIRNGKVIGCYIYILLMRIMHRSCI